RKPPQAAIRPGRPAPAMGPGTPRGELPMPSLMSRVYPGGVLKNGSTNALAVVALLPISPMLATISTLYSSPTTKGRIPFTEKELLPEGQAVKVQKTATCGRGMSAASRLEIVSDAFAEERR